MSSSMSRLGWTGLAGAALITALAGTAAAQAVKAPPPPVKNVPAAAESSLQPPQPPLPKSTVVEQVVARVNDTIITSVDYNQARTDLLQQLQSSAQQSGQTLSSVAIAGQEKDTLANLIDDQLLEQKAKDLGLNADTEVILQLDQMRKKNHLATMEDLQRAVESEGESYSDYEQSLKNQILQRMVIEQDVAPRVPQATPQQTAAYYNAHKAAYVLPEEVDLGEILITTQGKPASDQKRLKALAEQVQERAAKGEDFSTLAQRYSNASSASSGGDIGFERKDQLEASLAKTLFALPIGGVTPVETVPSGYLILKVTARHYAGQESLADATADIDYKLYTQMLQPELKTYLDKLRQEAYIVVKPGYVDTGAVTSAGVDITHFQRVLPTDLPKPTDKDKKGSGLNLGGGGGGE
ncbi:MAG: peptidylprolyl isomerase [Terriglobales bacterium]